MQRRLVSVLVAALVAAGAFAARFGDDAFRWLRGVRPIVTQVDQFPSAIGPILADVELDLQRYWAVTNAATSLNVVASNPATARIPTGAADEATALRRMSDQLAAWFCRVSVGQITRPFKQVVDRGGPMNEAAEEAQHVLRMTLEELVERGYITNEGADQIAERVASFIARVPDTSREVHVALRIRQLKRESC